MATTGRGVEYDPLGEEDMAEQFVEYEPISAEDMAERFDSDNSSDDDNDEQEEDDPCPRKVGDGEETGETSSDDDDDDDEEDPNPRKVSDGDPSSTRKRDSIALVDAPAGVVVPDEEFLGSAKFAAVKNTAGFMRIASTGSSQEGNREILVLYRYTRFSRTWSGRRGVDACRRTKLHWLRFAVPATGNMESAMVLAGSAVGPLIYPLLFRRELQDLWSSLAAAAAPANKAIAIPSQPTRLQVVVVVDAGILRPKDYTAERMEHMRHMLEATTVEAWPEKYHVGMEMRLPEPVREAAGRDDDDTRLAKRRRVVAVKEEHKECVVCLDLLENDLVAWPGCNHLFHAYCAGMCLAEKTVCPHCRRHL